MAAEARGSHENRRIHIPPLPPHLTARGGDLQGVVARPADGLVGVLVAKEALALSRHAHP